MRVCFITLNYKDGHRSARLAQKCASFKSIDHVIVVDNNSMDNSIDILSKITNESIDLIKSDSNVGFARGNNIGARYALQKYSPDYILFANPDTKFTNSDVEACIKELETRPDLGLISMRMKNPDGSEARSCWRFHSYYYYVFSNIWAFQHFTYKKNQYTNFEHHFQYVDIVRGSFMCFRAKALAQANLFDSGTFLYYEEEMIAKRLSSIGYHVGLLTDHSYEHDQIEDVSSSDKNQSSYLFFKKCYDDSLTLLLEEYYKINVFKRIILKACLRYSRFEYKLIHYLKDLHV